jgi:thioredoxin reductase (NADPH)
MGLAAQPHPGPAGYSGHDALIVGAGPAGLTAATYLARFRRRILVVDDGRSRALSIPISRNCPGFAHGVSGADLLAELRAQARAHGVEIRHATVAALRRSDEGFSADVAGAMVTPQAVVLATGIQDRLPALDGIHDAIRRGVVRLCAICDAYETAGKRVGVYGPAARVVQHARYLRAFSANVTALLADGPDVSADDRRMLGEFGIGIVRADRLELGDGGVRATAGDEAPLELDVLYPVLGAQSRSQLATALGARCDDEGGLVTDADMATSVPGLYAIGDVVSELNQIAVAMGHAALAATAIHNRLPFQPLP